MKPRYVKHAARAIASIVLMHCTQAALASLFKDISSMLGGMVGGMVGGMFGGIT